MQCSEDEKCHVYCDRVCEVVSVMKHNNMTGMKAEHLDVQVLLHGGQGLYSGDWCRKTIVRVLASRELGCVPGSVFFHCLIAASPPSCSPLCKQAKDISDWAG